MDLITIRLDKELKIDLQKYCKDHDRSVSSTVRLALREYLSKGSEEP